MVFRLDLKIFIFLILFYFTKQIKIYTLILIFAIIHEISHLIVGILLKSKVKKITLMPLGLSKLLIKDNEISQVIIYSNFLIAIFNFLPIYPLDGGYNYTEKIKKAKCYEYQDIIRIDIKSILFFIEKFY